MPEVQTGIYLEVKGKNQEREGEQDIPLQNMSLWHKDSFMVDYFEETVDTGGYLKTQWKLPFWKRHL